MCGILTDRKVDEIMNIISAIDSFKGSLDSAEINAVVKRVLEAKGHKVCTIPVADGGDGLLGALCASMGAKCLSAETVNALGEPITAKAAISGDTGIVEMALASGLALIDEDSLNPLEASTYGTGLMIRHLASLGVKKLILGIGGSATNDGGFGCLCALGYRFYSCDGEELAPKGANLERVDRISDDNVPEQIKKLDITIACDVTNPLLGERGATYVYAPQKGADRDMLERLEKGMASYARTVADFCGEDYSSLPGTGAAGGLGFGLMALLGAKPEKGANIVLDRAGYNEKLKSADLVITGEGRVDNQTAYGKLPQIVASRARSAGVKCIALCGSCTADRESLESMGISEVYCFTDYAPLRECIGKAESVAEKAIKSMKI